MNTESQQLFLTLGQCMKATEEHLQKCLLHYGLTPQQFNLLRILRGTHPRAQSMQEIKDKLIDRNADATRLVARMLPKNWIAMTIDPLDKRRKSVSILDNGLNLLNKIDSDHPNFPYSLADGLSPIQKQQLSELLVLWLESIQDKAI